MSAAEPEPTGSSSDQSTGQSLGQTPGQLYRLTVRYDGRQYDGWQRHAGKPTVQGALESAIVEVFGVKCAVHGSGRTDRGVHADAQVAHFEAPFELPSEQLLADLNGLLAQDVRVDACEAMAPGFHARHSAVRKTYRYEIWNAPQCPSQRVGRVWEIPGPLDVEAMQGATSVFVGAHDFSSFAKKTNYQPRTMVRTMAAVTLASDDSLIVMRFVADGFLYKMVRNIVRALVKVGEGRTDRARLVEILAARDRKVAPGTAPASGLFLESVDYADK
ncbi:MAG: tRNA pseudouridine(38-40) synthase TruA [Nannocystaceae bacterium]|nr:tRNA pseudouridine(38-40) synthase TruA [Nannocystaceae bacterium]